MSSALQAALKALKKNKIVDIKKAVVELGDSQKPIECIPTGSVVLDYLIGGYRTESGEKRCPGIPKGRITEIFGPEGSGKCVTAGTYVHSEYGMVTVGELFNLTGHTLDPDKDAVVPHEVDLLNEYGEMETTSHLTWNGRQRVNRITTSAGYQIEATDNHPVRVMNTRGNIVWKNAGDIQKGDYLVVMPAGKNAFMAGDSDRLSVSNVQSMAATGDLPKGESGGVEIPLSLRQGSLDIYQAFTSAYALEFSKENPETRRRYIQSNSYEFVRQFQMMLLSMGYVSRVSSIPAGGDDGEMGEYTLEFGDAYMREGLGCGEDQQPRDTIMCESHIPYVHTQVYDMMCAMGVLEVQGYRREFYNNANMGGISRKDFKNLVNLIEDPYQFSALQIYTYLQSIVDMGYFFDRVESIAVEDNVPTYDVCLPTTHSFWSNGLISHNTTIAIHTAIQCQKAGGTVCYLDYEHAFAPTYAADLGLDIMDDNFMLMQPRHWEEGAEIIKAMTEAGVDLIVIDSLAAMKPQRDIDDNDVSSTGEIGHIARLQSSFLPKIVNMLEDSKTALIYINQLRSRIKTSKYDAGPDEETAGGRALKYYASLRMEVKRIKSEYAQVENELTGKSEKQPISNIIRARNVKNKVSKHQGHTSEFVIRYGEGIDNVRSVIDIAEARNVIARAGAWYSFEDAAGQEAKAQGKEGLRDYFLANPDDFHALINKVSTFTRGRSSVKVSDDDIEVEEFDDDFEDDDYASDDE